MYTCVGLHISSTTVILKINQMHHNNTKIFVIGIFSDWADVILNKLLQILIKCWCSLLQNVFKTIILVCKERRPYVLLWVTPETISLNYDFTVLVVP